MQSRDVNKILPKTVNKRYNPKNNYPMMLTNPHHLQSPFLPVGKITQIDLFNL